MERLFKSTLKTRIYRVFVEQVNYRWQDVLPKLAESNKDTLQKTIEVNGVK